MKQIIILVLLSAVVVKAYAANSPKPAIIAPLAEHSLLLDIQYVEQLYLIAVGERGHIIRSFDGQTWMQSQVPVNSTLTAVHFQNKKRGWAVGHDATILHTRDGGETWEIQQYLPEKEKPLFDVLFKDENNGIAVGAYGLFYRTKDGGNTWQETFHETFLSEDKATELNQLKSEDEESYFDKRATILPHFNRVAIDGRTMYLAGGKGVIAKSNDFGDSWELYNTIYSGSFFDMDRTQSGNLMVVGLHGSVFRSLRNGTPWQKVSTRTTDLLNDIVLTDDERVVVIGNNGAILISADDGATFRSRPEPDGVSLIAGVWRNGSLVAVSENGVKTITIAR